ncbi:MAG: integrase family protein, partial [Chthonomonadales bacterium]|nr:integrase family protein [Chthonomonadales bacterium]
KTERYYKVQLTQLIAWTTEKDVALPDFRARHMRSYMAMRADSVSRRTQYHDALCAKVFLKFCLREGYTEVDALGDYVVPKPPVSHVRKPTIDDIQKLLKAVREKWDPAQNPKARFTPAPQRAFIRTRDYAMICLLVEAGCRIGECLDLVMSDVDLKECKLTFRETKGKTWRSVPMTSALQEALQPWISLRLRIERDKAADVGRGKEARCGDHFFLTMNGDRVTAEAWAKAWVAYVEYAGIEYFTRHGLRHFTIHEMAKVNVRSAQQIAGHKKLDTTQVYLHDDPDQVRADHALAAPLGKILFNTRSQKQRRNRIV